MNNQTENQEELNDGTISSNKELYGTDSSDSKGEVFEPLAEEMDDEESENVTEGDGEDDLLDDEDTLEEDDPLTYDDDEETD